jgi:hypothetical protein
MSRHSRLGKEREDAEGGRRRAEALLCSVPRAILLRSSSRGARRQISAGRVPCSLPAPARPWLSDVAAAPRRISPVVARRRRAIDAGARSAAEEGGGGQCRGGRGPLARRGREHRPRAEETRRERESGRRPVGWGLI